ncbi:MAG: trimethylamine methyltransferase family protein, partial [Pseudomonadota bacterium]
MRRTRRDREQSARKVDYRHLNQPFAPASLFSDVELAQIHETALEILEEAGLRILNAEARDLLHQAGARVDEDMVRIGRDMIGAAIASAPKSFVFKGAVADRDQVFETGRMVFGPAGGCPNAHDLVRGRRPGDAVAFTDAIKLQQHFDAIHILGPSAEPQDVPIELRHYFSLETQMTLSDKPLTHYARGRRQCMDGFDMVQIGRGLSDDEFQNNIWMKTVINTNSPRLIDNPMAEGIIDFARNGQMLIITPFCLSGAMAPITAEGALTLQHLEVLAGLTLAQIAKPGAPVVYGGFSSNVDMKSGAPAFGTPEHIKLLMGTGQMARHLGLPWRSGAGAAGPTVDMQTAAETHMALWGSLMGNATLTIHAAGWLEGGLTFGYEKFIMDMEALQVLAELPTHPMINPEATKAAILGVQPGGHFFDQPQTMALFSTAFYEPLIASYANYGLWEEQGKLRAEERATQKWQHILDEFTPPRVCDG